VQSHVARRCCCNSSPLSQPRHNYPVRWRVCSQLSRESRQLINIVSGSPSRQWWHIAHPLPVGSGCSVGRFARLSTRRDATANKTLSQRTRGFRCFRCSSQYALSHVVSPKTRWAESRSPCRTLLVMLRRCDVVDRQCARGRFPGSPRNPRGQSANYVSAWPPC
jgi:hypothetical protein